MRAILLLFLTSVLSFSSAQRLAPPSSGSNPPSNDSSPSNNATTGAPIIQGSGSKYIDNIWNILGGEADNRTHKFGLQTSLTCNNLQDFNKKYPRMNMGNLMEMVGLKNTDQPFNPDDEEHNTEMCRVDKFQHAQELFLKKKLINFESVTFNLFVFFAIFLGLIGIEFALANYGMSLIRKGKNVLNYTLPRVFYSRLGPDGYQEAEQVLKNERKPNFWWHRLYDRILVNNLDSQTGEEEKRLLGFEKGLIIIMIPMMVVTLVDDGADSNMILGAIFIFVWFLIGCGVFYKHGDRSKIINGLAQQQTNQFKTLLISKVDPQDCNEAFIRTYFLDQDGDTVAGVSLIRKVDTLEKLDEELTIAQLTKEVLEKTPKEERAPIKLKSSAQPIDSIEYYDNKIKQLTSSIDEELHKIPQQSVTAAFVTFTSRERAMSAYNFHQSIKRKLCNPFGISVDWAPPIGDIVWSTMHKQGNFTQLILMIILYFFRILISLGGPSGVTAIVRALNPVDSFIVDHVMPYMKSFMTMTFWCLACCLDIVSHSRNSSTHLGLFFSSIIIQLISEIFLPMIMFTDIADSVLWMAESPTEFNHWLRLQCIFRPELGREMSICIIKWSFLQSTFVMARIPHIYHSIRIKLTAACPTEAEFMFSRKSVEFEVGNRYAELVAQFLLTLIGAFSYPHIIMVSLYCMLIRYLIDSYQSCKTFSPTTTGISIHRWAILFALLSFAFQCLLLVYRNSVNQSIRPDYELLLDSLVVILAVFFFILIILTVMTLYFCFSTTQQYCEYYGALEECQHYIPTVVLKWTKHLTNTTITTNPNPSEELYDEGKLIGLFRILKILSIIGGVILLFVGILVAILRSEYKPPISYNKKMDVPILADDHYNLTLYAGRVPHTTMAEECPRQNPKSKNGWLVIKNQCEDLLIDTAVNNNYHSIFARVDPDRRFVWTAGYYNLTQNDKFQWMDKKVFGFYKNFCNTTENDAVIAKAKEEEQTILYVVKDFTEASKKQNKNSACWRTFSAQQLSSLGFGFLNDKTPRLSFICKSIDKPENITNHVQL